MKLLFQLSYLLVSVLCFTITSSMAANDVRAECPKEWSFTETNTMIFYVPRETFQESNCPNFVEEFPFFIKGNAFCSVITTAASCSNNAVDSSVPGCGCLNITNGIIYLYVTTKKITFDNNGDVYTAQPSCLDAGFNQFLTRDSCTVPNFTCRNGTYNSTDKSCECYQNAAGEPLFSGILCDKCDCPDKCQVTYGKDTTSGSCLAEDNDAASTKCSDWTVKNKNDSLDCQCFIKNAERDAVFSGVLCEGCNCTYKCEDTKTPPAKCVDKPTTTTTTTTTTLAPETMASSMSTPNIVILVTLGIAICICLLGVIYMYYRKKNKAQEMDQTDKTESFPTTSGN